MKLEGETISRRDEIIRDGLRFYTEMGYPPSSIDFSYLPHYPNPKTVKKYFGKWKDYIASVPFPVPTKRKRDVNSFYIGDSYWMRSDNYKKQMENMHTDLWDWLVQNIGGEGLVPNEVHEQVIIVFQWKKVDYAVSYLNIYTENYAHKIRTIINVLEDMNIKLINLNGKNQWWERTLRVALGIEKFGEGKTPRR